MALSDKPLDEENKRLIKQLFQGNRRALGRLISHIENGSLETAKAIIKEIYPYTGKAYIIGITGAPGSGKSTLTNQLAKYYLEKGLKISIIAVDPTSPFSGGALLGDRIRMKENFSKKNLFIRSMANRGQLGGLARRTKDVISLLDAYGSDIIIIETVGVGQSEIDIFKIAHTTLVLVVPGLGDEIQAIKAGLMEITDIFIVNKADLPGADKKVADIQSMLNLSDQIDVKKPFQNKYLAPAINWKPPIIKIIALNGENIDGLAVLIEKHKNYLEKTNLKRKKELLRQKHYVLEILKQAISRNLEELIFENKEIEKLIENNNSKLKKEKSKENNKESEMKLKDPYELSKKILQEFLMRFL